MNLLPVCIVLISCALMKGCVEAIQCYACDDCQALNDNFLELCLPEESALVVAWTTTTTPEEMSTTSFPETTQEPATEADKDVTEAENVEAQSAGIEDREAVAAEDEGPQPASLVLSPVLSSSLDSPRIKREFANNPLSHHCFSMERKDGGRMKTKKGCIEVPVNASGCAILKEKYDASEKNCRICSEDKCNSGVVLRYSLAAAVLVIVNSFCQW